MPLLRELGAFTRFLETWGRENSWEVERVLISNHFTELTKKEMRDKTRTKLTAGLTLSLSKQKQTKNIFCLTPDWRQNYKQFKLSN